MFLIVMGHFCTHSNIASTSSENVYFSYVVLRSIAIGAVDCFVMISGYYGIKFKVQRLVTIEMQLIFYSILLYFVSGLFFGTGISTMGILRSVFPFSQEVYWFATKYIMLMFVAPLLVKARSCRNVVIVLFIVLSIIPFICINPIVQSYGYDVLNLILCYLIGGACNVETRNSKKSSIIGWGVLWVAITIVMVVIVKYTGNMRVWYYYSPFCILQAVALIKVFASLPETYSRSVNVFASSMFGVYLISDHPSVRLFIYDYLGINESIETIVVVAKIVMFSLAILVICAVIDIIRERFAAPLNPAFPGIYNEDFVENH